MSATSTLYASDELQACEPAALIVPDGVTAIVSDELDSMGFHSVTLYSETPGLIRDTILRSWGDSDADWYSDRVDSIHPVRLSLSELLADAPEWMYHDDSYGSVSGDEDPGFRLAVSGLIGIVFRPQFTTVSLGEPFNSTHDVVTCPACGHDNVSMCGTTGDEDLADWWTCETYDGGCGQNGALVRPDTPWLTQNGHLAETA